MKKKIGFLIIFLAVMCVSHNAFAETFEVVEHHIDGRYTKYEFTLNDIGEITELLVNTYDAQGNSKPTSFDMKVSLISKDSNEYIFQSTMSTETVLKHIIVDDNSIWWTGWWYTPATEYPYSKAEIYPHKEIFFQSDSRTIKRNSHTLEHTNNLDIYSFENGILYALKEMDFYDRRKIEYEIAGGKPRANLYVIHFSDSEKKYVLQSHFDIGVLNLHSENMYVNIVNYLLLLSVEENIQEVFFPLIFMEDPFSLESNWQYSASSYLTETNATYGAENLATLEELPWASGNGYGIGDVITINMLVRPNEQIAFYNGFQSTDRPHLYEQNSRVKRIKITHKEGGNSMYYTLNDTPDKQVIDIASFLHNVGVEATLEIEILEVYPGSKYTDLCIQAMLPGSVVE